MSFTRAAEKRWKSVPDVVQEQILSNVYCTKCRACVQMVLMSGEMEKGDLILKGTCKTCGGSVTRVVEPEG
jgi:hypothetical protein